MSAGKEKAYDAGGIASRPCTKRKDGAPTVSKRESKNLKGRPPTTVAVGGDRELETGQAPSLPRIVDGFITGVTLRHLTLDPTLKSASVGSLMKDSSFISKGRARSISISSILRSSTGETLLSRRQRNGVPR